MSADKFNCPKCGVASAVTATIVGKRETTRYRHCRICNINFATCEAVKDTPRVRSWLGDDRANELWPAAPFKYRTIAQQKRAAKSKP